MTSLNAQSVDNDVVKICEILVDLPHSEARTDCFGALDAGINSLERFLDEHLWLPSDYPAFAGEKESAYYKALAAIEEILVNQDLIYKNGAPY